MNDQAPLARRSETRSGGRSSEGSRGTRRTASFAQLDAQLEIRARITAAIDEIDGGDAELAAANLVLLLDDLDGMAA